MAITFIGSGTGSAVSGGDPTVILPGGVAAGDLIILAYAIGDNDDVDFDMSVVSPSGYAELADLFSNDDNEANLGVYWKIAGVGEANPVLDGLGGTDAAVAAACLVFRGTHATTPIDTEPIATATGLDTAHPDPPSHDHGNPSGVWTVIVGACGRIGGSGAFTNPTGYTTNAVSIGSDDTIDVCLGMGYNTAPADPENPGVMTHSLADNVAYAWAAATLALRPAATTPTRGRISWAELETPFVPTRGRVSWAELEVPAVPTRGRLSWSEFEVPDVGAAGPGNRFMSRIGIHIGPKI